MNRKLFNLIIPFALFLFFCPSEGSAQQNVVISAHTEVELIPEVLSIQPGRPFWVALRMKMEKDWHTYWINGGDSGLGTTIAWSLPQGFQAGKIHWPYPHRINVPPLTSYGYDGEIFLLTKFDAADSVNVGQTLSFKAKVDWLACEKICLPGTANLSFALPVSGTPPQADLKWIYPFSKTRAEHPVETSFWSLEAYDAGDRFFILMDPPQDAYSLSTVNFFPYRNDIIDHADIQKLVQKGKSFELQVKKSSLLNKPLDNLHGVLVSKEGWRGVNSQKALLINIPVKTSVPKPGLSIFIAMAFAFAGGLILNLMPCVLPVLSIKILSLIEHKDDKKSAWRNGLLFSLGILVSFWVLAGLLIIFKSGGEQIGWGYQFHSPVFLVLLSAFFMLFALNLFGIFEVGTSFIGAGGNRKDRSAFMSGVLATIVATPCTAPFMGTALGFALTQPAYIALVIFTFLGLGMAFPFLVISKYPALIKFLPKPGRWMLTLKKCLGAVLLATVAWLLWVYGLQLGPKALAVQIIALMTVGVGAWIYGLSIRFNSARNVAIITFVFGAGLALYSTTLKSDMGVRRAVESQDWLEYSPELIRKLRSERKAVFIDFTAAWCLSCQVNERVVLQNKTVAAKFNKLGVVKVKADWTTRDETIAKALEDFGRSGVPLYVLYSRDPQKPPVILPEIITHQIILKTLEENVN